MKRHHLLLIHGFPHDSTLWERQVVPLGEEANVIAPDLRGFGAGNDQYVPEVMSMTEYAHDLKQLLDQKFVERAVICGISMGGYVALSFLDLFPERVKALILCNTKATGDDEEAKRKRYEVAEKAFKPGMPLITRELLPKLISQEASKNDPEVVRLLEYMMLKQRPDAVAAAARGMAKRPDRTELLKKMDLPTLIITGDEDAIMDLSTSEQMHENIKGSELEVIQGAGHLSNIEKPERFNEVVLNFLRKIPD